MTTSFYFLTLKYPYKLYISYHHSAKNIYDLWSILPSPMMVPLLSIHIMPSLGKISHPIRAAELSSTSKKAYKHSI